MASVIPVAAMQREDVSAALELWQRCEGLTLREVDAPMPLGRFLLRNPGLSFVAREGRSLVGAILCGEDGRRGYLHHLAVAREHRRRGIGRELVEHCMTALEACGLSKCHLFVRIENDAARQFWRSIGWDEREDVCMMSHVLSGSSNA